MVRDDTPILAIEFDGVDHLRNPETLKLDNLKNRLCRSADLPLLRVMSEEIREHDRLTLLDYMLIRYVAWQREFSDIVKELRQRAAGLPDHADSDDLATELDPVFEFDLRHPFPMTATTRARLWRRHRFAWVDDYERRGHNPKGIWAVELTGFGPLIHDEFHTCEATATIWTPKDIGDEPLYRHRVSVTVRACMRLRPDPDVDEGALFGLPGLEPLTALTKQYGIPAHELWFSNIPGVNAWDIARHYVDYLGVASIDRWAQSADLGGI